MSDSSDSMGAVTRREALAALALLPIGAFDRSLLAERARHYFSRPLAPPATPRFFTPHEWRTVRMLADYVIPRDERSGSATEAGVPEFMDFIMLDRPALQTPMRGGLHWLDTYCHSTFGAAFVDCAPADRAHALDAIAWPQRARSEMSQGVAFFTTFRDLTASGFWSSPMGVADLRYLGNTVEHEWTGCPQATLDKLGVSY
jgi:gluconate 2-dehydrogenase gamma chain